jgi:hypothetical protein
MVVRVAVAGRAIAIRVVHPVAEAAVPRTALLPAAALKVDQAEEAAPVQVKVKAVPGNNQVFYRTGLFIKG